MVSELQGKFGTKKKVTVETLTGVRDLSRKTRLSDSKYKDSFFENRANMLKELNHIREARKVDAVKMAQKVGKYFPRQLDAAFETGIKLNKEFSKHPELANIIDLSIEVNKRRGSYVDVVEFLKERGISEADFVNSAEKASNILTEAIIKNMFFGSNKS